MTDVDDRVRRTLRDALHRGSELDWDVSPEAVRNTAPRAGWLRTLPRSSHIGLVAAVVALIVAGSLVGVAATASHAPAHLKTEQHHGRPVTSPPPPPNTAPTTTVPLPTTTTTAPVTSTTAPPTTTTTTPTGTVPPAAALPTVTIASWTGTEPAIIYFSGDGGNVATGLTWSVWNQTEAVGQGTRDELGCVPSCAAGSVTPYPVTITLSNPVNGSFTTLVEQTSDGKGTSETFTAPQLGQGACTTSDPNSCKFTN